jgi:hypothetical protein
MGTGIGGIRQCFNEPATVKVTVRYNDVESDTHVLCDECGRELKRDARSHGYSVSTTPMGMSAAEERKARSRANGELAELGRTYHVGLALDKVDEILVRNGFDELDVLVSGERRLHEQVGPHTWLSVAWHRMEVTGRYEIVAYLS